MSGECARSGASTARSSGIEVRLEELRRRFGSVTALDGLTLTLQPGELVALLGPSGCGKSTALRIVAGLEDADSGRVRVGGRDITDIPSNRRDMGMVFQAYSLFPHMTAWENAAFGLRMRGVGSSKRKARALEMLELVGLSDHAHRYPHQMSGGQQQRVALARALAFRPMVLLLDEPLAALDAKVRARLRDEIRKIQLEVGTTTLFVTHDQEEALAIADRIGVMRSGRLEQLGSPVDVYARPQTPFVAEFVGLSNRLPARISAGGVEVLGSRLPIVNRDVPAGDAIAIVRPEAINVVEHRDGDSGDPRLIGKVVAISFHGASSRLSIDLTGGLIVIAVTPTSEASAFRVGMRARIVLRGDPVLVTSPRHAETEP